MKAMAYRRFGPPEVLEMLDVPRPQPGRHEVLIEVHAVALNPKDILIRKGKFALLSGKRFPRIAGYDVAGVVSEVGPGCARFAVGDPVFGMINRWDAGGCAEYVAVPERELTRKPDSLSMTGAAALPLASLTALQALRDLLNLQPSQRIMINGASGGVGTMAVQIARILGAHVIAVCSYRNTDHVCDLGAQDVIDYTQQDPLQTDLAFDAFCDLFGNYPYSKVHTRLASPRRYVTALPRPSGLFKEALARLGMPFPRTVVVQSKAKDLEQLATWTADGSLRPVVDRILPLEQAQDAHTYIETKRARGKVVLQIRP